MRPEGPSGWRERPFWFLPAVASPLTMFPLYRCQREHRWEGSRNGQRAVVPQGLPEVERAWLQRVEQALGQLLAVLTPIVPGGWDIKWSGDRPIVTESPRRRGRCADCRRTIATGLAVRTGATVVTGAPTVT